jgi:hypothetical protein
VQFTIARGSLPQIRFALPEGLDVRQVELAGRPGPSATLSAPAIRQWDIVGKDATRQLVIDFVQPVAGSATLLIEMIPRLTLAPGEWLLRLPAPLVGTSTAGILAYRVDGMETSSSAQNLSVGTVIPPALLAERWAKLALRETGVRDTTLREPAAATKILNFRRTSPAAALGLTVQPTRPAAQVDASWKIGAHVADLTAQLSLRSAADDLVLVEFELPPRLKLVSLGGPDAGKVHHFSRQDRRMQVWLQQPRKQIELELHGWIEHAPAGPPMGPGSHLELSPVRVLNARATGCTLTVAAEPGLAAEPQRIVQLTRIVNAGPLRYSCAGDQYEASFALRAVPIPGRCRAFTLVERRGDVVEMSTALHLQAPPGEFRVRFSGWDATEPRLDTPAAIVQRAHQHQGKQHVWTLVIPPGMPQTVTLTLVGRVSSQALAKAWPLPVVAIEPYPLSEHWIGLSDIEPATKDGLAVQPAEAGDKEKLGAPAPPHELPPGTRLGKLKAVGDAPLLRMPPFAAATSAQPMFAQHDAFWGGRGWLHQLRITAFSGEQGELHLRLPNGAQCLAIATGAIATGSRVTVPAAGPLVIPLPGPPGPREAVVCWQYADAESDALPRLDAPEVAGLPPEAMHARVWLPPTSRLATPLAAVAENDVDSLLKQAEMQMLLCKRCADARVPGERLLPLQQLFHGLLAEAELSMARLAPSSEPGRLAELRRRAKDLATENARLAREAGYPVAPGDPPQRSALGPSLSTNENGLPICIAAGSRPQVISTPASPEVLARTATEILLLAAVTLLLLSYLRRVFTLFEVLWPEWLLLLALLGISIAGWSLMGGVLVAVAIALRITWTIIVAQRVLPAWFAANRTQSHGDNGPLGLPSG